MAYELVRDAPFGQLVRYLTGNRFFLYPEERPGFQCPLNYSEPDSVQNDKKELNTPGETPGTEGIEPKFHAPVEESTPDLEKGGGTSTDSDSGSIKRTVSREAGLVLDKKVSRKIVPAMRADGIILADWYTTDDPANPQNWSQGKKFWTAFLIDLYTFVVYSSSSIYVPSIHLIMEHFGVQEFKAGLGLAVYVLGYGLGPLLFAPLSEVPTFGRNLPYITTFALFVILSVPLSLVDNLGGLIFLRFLLGFFGSPCLANGGATMADIYSDLYLPFSIASWVSAAFAGPALGPLLSGFAVYAKNWRWSQWEILWLSAPVFLLFFFALPETHPDTILLNRAARLRKASGNEKIRSQSEIDRQGLSLTAVIIEAIVKPLEICIKDPAILFVNIYTALTYGIYYSFFEVFTLVYPVMYGFNVGETGVVFLCIIVGCFLSMGIYFPYIWWVVIPDIKKNGTREQEHWLRPALIACVGPVVGLFIFGWGANPKIHWIVSVIGIMIQALSVYILLQCIFTYVPKSYPQYAASLFASNDFFRSFFAFGAVMIGRPLYINLGVAKGVTLLASLSVIGIIGMWLLYFYGAKLRARSKFATSEAAT